MILQEEKFQFQFPSAIPIAKKNNKEYSAQFSGKQSSLTNQSSKGRFEQLHLAAFVTIKEEWTTTWLPYHHGAEDKY